MKEIPDNVHAYNKVEYTDKTTPGMMKNEHSTRPGVWGKIVVEKGEVRFELPSESKEHLLTPENYGVIEPSVVHKIDPGPGAKFYLEFYR